MSRFEYIVQSNYRTNFNAEVFGYSNRHVATIELSIPETYNVTAILGKIINIGITDIGYLFGNDKLMFVFSYQCKKVDEVGVINTIKKVMNSFLQEKGFETIPYSIYRSSSTEIYNS